MYVNVELKYELIYFDFHSFALVEDIISDTNVTTLTKSKQYVRNEILIFNKTENVITFVFASVAWLLNVEQTGTYRNCKMYIDYRLKIF